MTDQVLALPLTYKFDGKLHTIVLPIIGDQDQFILVDATYPGFLSRIQKGLAEHGLDLAQCSGVFVTHHDIDHIGSLADLVRDYPQIKVYSSAVQKPYIEGKRSLRLLQAEKIAPLLPPEMQEKARMLEKLFASGAATTVDRVVGAGDLLPWGGGTQVLDTSGHMPGHLSLYLPASRVLIPGDALVFENGVLDIASESSCLDYQQAIRSIDQLIDLPIDRIVCTHGGVVTDQIPQRLQAIVTKKRKKQKVIRI